MIEGMSDGGLGVLLLGVAVGVQHAFEADHIAAVSSLAAPQKSVRRIIAHGAVWGLGHTATLMVVTGGAIVFGLAISQPLTEWLELLVGVYMLQPMGMRGFSLMDLMVLYLLQENIMLVQAKYSMILTTRMQTY